MKTILTSLRTTKFSAALILLTIVLCLIGVRPVFAATVGIDNSHIIYGSYFHPAETLYSGGVFDYFQQIIEDLGHTVVPLTSFSQGDLSSVDIAILAIPTAYPTSAQHPNLPYSESEMAAIQALASKRAVFLGDSYMIQALWAEIGNRMLVENIINFLLHSRGALFVSEWGTDNYAPDFVNWNNLLEPFGVEYSDIGTDYNNHYINDFVPHQITAGVSSVLAGGMQNRITANYPSVDLTEDLNEDPTDTDAADILAAYEAEPGFSVFMNYDSTEVEGVGGFFFLPGSSITLEIDCEPDGTVDYTETRVVNPDGSLGFDLAGFNCDVWAGSLFRMYYTLDPSVVKEHIVDYITLDDIDFVADTLSGRADPGTELEVRVFDPNQQFPGGYDQSATANASGNWSVSFDGTYDIIVGSRGWILTSREGNHTQIEWSVLAPPLDLEVDGTLDPSSGLPGPPLVTDDVYQTAEVYLVTDLPTQTLDDPIDVKIHVFDEQPIGIPAIATQGSKFMHIELEAVGSDPLPYPLPPMGVNIHIPLLEPMPAFPQPYHGGVIPYYLELYRIDPWTGALVRAERWRQRCVSMGPTGCDVWEVFLAPAHCNVLSGPGYVPCPPGTHPSIECGMWAACQQVATFSTVVGVLEETIPVEIDVKPGSDPNSINCNNAKGVIPVAILTTDDFDATTVDHTTVTFEGGSETHVDQISGKPHRHEEDVEGDGDIDLVFHFRLGDTSLTCDSTEGTLTGETFAGQPIIGTDSVRMIQGDGS